MQPTFNLSKYISRLLRRVLSLLLVFALLAGFPMPFSNHAQAASNGMIRVKLTRLGTQSAIRFTTSCGYVLSGDVPLNIPANSSVTVTAEGDEMWVSCGGVNVCAGKTARLLRTQRGNSGVKFTLPALSNTFCGDLYFSASGGSITPILNIYIEDYLYGVVAYEMSNSYPLEALKAQAVAARNYALRKKSSSSSKAYDVTDTTSDQVFRGYNASYARVIQAVDETAGQVLYSGGSMVNCYYTASNGGQTEATANVWGGKLAYSIVQDDPYDLENASARQKTAEIPRDASGLKPELEAALLSGIADQLLMLNLSIDAEDVSIASISGIEAIEPKYAEPSRLYKTLRFTMRVSSVSMDSGKRSYAVVTADVPTYDAFETWYALSINSGSNETIEVAQTETAFQVIFRRYGHGVGMSQRGAQTMAANYGKTFEDILYFYYPGTQLERLSLADTGGSGFADVDGTLIATAELASATELLKSADPDSDILANLTAGSKAEVYEVNGRWAKIAVRGAAGYVRTDALAGFTLAEDPLEKTKAEELCWLSQDASLLELPVLGAYQTAALPAGTQLMLLAKSPAWVQVSTPDAVIGYLPADLLTETAPSSTPEPTAEPTPEPTATPEATSWPTFAPLTTPTAQPTATLPALTAAPSPTATLAPWPTQEAAQDFGSMTIPGGTLFAYVDITGSTLTVRQRASTSSLKLAALSRGDCVQMLAYDEDWAFIMTGSGVRGFVATRYLRFTPETATAQPTAAATTAPTLSWPTATPEPTAKPTAAPTATPKPTAKPTAKPTQAVAEDGFQPVSGTRYVYVNTEKAKLRKSASESASTIATVKYSKKLQLKAYSDGWYCVSYDGDTAYIRRCDASTEKPLEVVETKLVFCDITAKTRYSTRMYKKNSTSSSVLSTLPSGASVKVSAYNDSWAYVRYGSKSGFIQLKYLKAVS